jgi:hypothetical protein
MDRQRRQARRRIRSPASAPSSTDGRFLRRTALGCAGQRESGVQCDGGVPIITSYKRDRVHAFRIGRTVHDVQCGVLYRPDSPKLSYPSALDR